MVHGMAGMKRTFQEFSKEGDLDSTADSRQPFTKRMYAHWSANSNKAIPTMSRQFDLIKHQPVDSSVQRHQPSSLSSSSSLASKSLQLGAFPSSSRSASETLPLPPLPSSSEVICDSLLVQLKEALKRCSEKFSENQNKFLLKKLCREKAYAEFFLECNEENQYLQCLDYIAFQQRYCDGRCNGRPASDYHQLQPGPLSSKVISESLLKKLYEALHICGKKLTCEQNLIALAGLSSYTEIAEKFLAKPDKEKYIDCLEYVAIEQRLCNGPCNGFFEE